MNLTPEIETPLRAFMAKSRAAGYNGGFILVTNVRSLHNQEFTFEGANFRWRYHKELPMELRRDGEMSEVYVVTKRDYKHMMRRQQKITVQ